MATQDKFGFIPLPGRRFKNVATGEEISRRQYDKITKGIKSYEAKAKQNLLTDASAQIARPARGRSSLQKLAEGTRQDIIRARQEEKARIETAKKTSAAERAAARELERLKSRKVHQKTIRPQLLKSGSRGALVRFADYDGYVRAMKEAKQSGVVIGTVLQWEGYDTRDNRTKIVSIQNGQVLGKPIDEEEFDEIYQESIQSKSYMVFLNYAMHVMFKKEYADKRAAKLPVKRVAPKRKRKGR